MLIFLIALVIGLLIGLFTNVNVPSVYYPYLTLLILVSLDSLIGAARAIYAKTYANSYFLLSWFTDALAVVVFNALGDAIGVDLAVPLVIYLGMRMFHNIDKLRRTWYKRQTRRRRLLRVWIDEEGESSDLPVEDINPDNQRQVRAEVLRKRAKNLRIEADSLVNEADALEESEALDQLQSSRRAATVVPEDAVTDDRGNDSRNDSGVVDIEAEEVTEAEESVKPVKSKVDEEAGKPKQDE